MYPFECINRACRNLLRYKGLQIIVENMTSEVESFDLGGGWHLSAPNIPIQQKVNHNVTIRLNHNYHIDLVFDDDDFNISKPWNVEDEINTAGLSEDDKQVARFMYFFWKLNDYMQHPRGDTGPLAELIFTKLRTIRQTL